jgi:hypothetical protein
MLFPLPLLACELELRANELELMVSGANELDELELQTDELDFERTVPPEQNCVDGL